MEYGLSFLTFKYDYGVIEIHGHLKKIILSFMVSFFLHFAQVPRGSHNSFLNAIQNQSFHAVLK